MSKATDKYQITLPNGVRAELGIVPGTDVDIVKEGIRFLLVLNLPPRSSNGNGGGGSRTAPPPRSTETRKVGLFAVY
jgi:AbrB family looped-hinge helix DNA binding protein